MYLLILGICRHENRTYQNKEKVISSDPCSVNCSCLNSVVHCDFIECTLVPPESGVNCKVKKKPDECCPEYVCGKFYFNLYLIYQICS